MPASQLLLPALNEMFDIANERMRMPQTRIRRRRLFPVLVVLALVSAFLVGDGMSESKTASQLHMVSPTPRCLIVVYVVIDSESRASA